MPLPLLLPPQQSVYDEAGNRVLDACLYVYQAGTTTPVPVFQDAALVNRHPMPVPSKGNGILPLVYIAPGSYRLRFEDPDGCVYDQVEDLTVEGSTPDDSGSGDVDALRLFQTGDIKDRYGSGSHPGWCRLNGRTIGSSASAGSERANDDAHDLFVFLWNADTNLAVAGDRGVNAETDWAAAKTIALPDQAGRFRLALDDLGAGAKGRLNGGLFSFGGSTALGSYGGEASHVQTSDEMALHGHAITATMDAQGGHDHVGTTGTIGDHVHGVGYNLLGPVAGGPDLFVTTDAATPDGNTLGSSNPAGAHSHPFTTSFAGVHAHTVTASASTAGISTAMNWLPPFLLISSYIKL